MRAGRELDILVAEKVMGICSGGKQHYYTGNDDGEIWVCDVPNYSTDIAHAWQVVEKLNLLDDGDWLSKYNTINGNTWIIGSHDPYGSWEIEVEGESPAHAICLAALKAVGVKI